MPMTLDEAQTITRIIGQADNADPVTVGNLVVAFNDAMLGHIWTATAQVEYDDGAGPNRPDGFRRTGLTVEGCKCAVIRPVQSHRPDTSQLSSK